ncbi:hypothetical protein [Aquitalea sp. ASV15]|uniref:hypothetical protein n=1 Tax=Aquitalea sp. ASV15 TaxID=2795104 RepID=UPI0018EC35FF|nr:hypothetical protein [Aquitalea sp. ASV15]
MSKPCAVAIPATPCPTMRQSLRPSGTLPEGDCSPRCHGSSFLCHDPAARLIPCGHARPPGV